MLFVGIDIAKRNHEASVIAQDGSVVRKAMRDSLNGRMVSFFGAAANTVHVLSCVMPACARMAIWNIIRR